MFRVYASVLCRIGLSLYVPMMTFHQSESLGQQPKRVAFRDRVASLIILTDQTRLYGVPVPNKTNTFLFRTEWIRENAAPFFHDQVEPSLKAISNASQNDQIAELIRNEIRELEQAPEKDLQRIGLMKEYLSLEPANPVTLPELVQVQLPPKMIRRYEPQSPRNQQLGLPTFLNRLPEPETIPWQQALQQLQAIPPDKRVTAMPSSISPPVIQQWDQFETAIDFRTAKVAEFISTGSTLVLQDENTSLQAIMSQMLAEQAQSQLAELLGPEFGGTSATGSKASFNRDISELPASVQKTAADRDVKTVSISGFSIQPEAGLASTWRVLFHRTTENRWQAMFRVASEASATALSPEQKDAVASDPQVQQVRQFFSGLGIADSQFDQATSLGAVVRLANDRTEAAVQERISALLKGQFNQSEAVNVPLIVVEQPKDSRD